MNLPSDVIILLRNQPRFFMELERLLEGEPTFDNILSGCMSSITPSHISLIGLVVQLATQSRTRTKLIISLKRLPVAAVRGMAEASAEPGYVRMLHTIHAH